MFKMSSSAATATALDLFCWLKHFYSGTKIIFSATKIIFSPTNIIFSPTKIIFSPTKNTDF